MKKILFFAVFFICTCSPFFVYAEIVASSVAGDTTWNSAGSPYIIHGEVVVQGGTLTIDPGTTIQFGYGSRLRVTSTGSVNAIGTAENHSTITILPGSESAPVDFGGTVYGRDISFASGSHGTFVYVDFVGDSSVSEQAIFADNATIQIERSRIQGYKNYGVYIMGGSVDISTSTFAEAPVAGIFLDTVFTHTDNTLITMRPAWMLNGDVASGVTRHLSGSDGAYYLPLGTIARTGTLVIDPGVSIYIDQQFDAPYFNVLGTLSVEGTAEAPVTIYGAAGACSTHQDAISFVGYPLWSAPLPTVTINHAIFQDLCGGITGSHSLLNISNTDFIRVDDTVIDHTNGELIVTDTLFENNLTALALTAMVSVAATNNSIHGNSTGLSVTSNPNLVVANNWWGSALGPTITINIGGDGQLITATDSEGLVYGPWLTADPRIIVSPAPTRDPVIIIPGIMGTKLFKNYGDHLEVWPNIPLLIFDLIDELLNSLILLNDNTEDPNKPVIFGDVIRSGGGVDVFNGLINKLEENNYYENIDFYMFSYDWRFSNNLNKLKLKEKIEAVLVQTGKSKVDIIAHSMGGILTKTYIAQNGTHNVDQLFFVGTPHLGAPKAFKALMYGDNMGYEKLGINILNPKRVKIIAQNMPSIFELLPSRKYVNSLDNKYVNSNGLQLGYVETNDFLVQHNKHYAMLANADILHSGIDDLDLSGIQSYDFAGCGVGKTIEKINISENKYSLVYGTGDETVPLTSATAGNTNAKYYVKESSHAELPSVEPVRNAIVALLKGDTVEGVSTDDSICNISGKAIEIHSPVTLHIYDELGGHVGPMPDGTIEYGIEGVSYDVIEGEKFAFLPEGHTYRIVNTAEATGTYDVVISDVGDTDIVSNTRYFNDVPIQTIGMNAQMTVGDDSAEYSLQLDQGGDGLYETVLISAESDQVARSSSGGVKKKQVAIPEIPDIINSIETQLVVKSIEIDQIQNTIVAPKKKVPLIKQQSIPVEKQKEAQTESREDKNILDKKQNLFLRIKSSILSFLDLIKKLFIMR